MRKTMKKIISLALVLTFSASILAGCGSNESKTPVADTTTDSVAGKNYAILVKSAGNPYNEKESAGFKATIEAAGGTAIVKAPESATGDAPHRLVAG